MWFQSAGERMLGMICATVVMMLFLVTNPGMVREYHGKAGKCNPGTPITISSGGTYSGCYLSRNASVPAVNITTTSAVTFSRAVIHHKGIGVRAVDARANLTVQDSVFTAMSPGLPTDQAAMFIYQPIVLTVENNRFTDGHGVTVNGNNLTTSPFSISKNDFVNTGRYNEPACCTHSIWTDKVLAPDGLVEWNRLNQTYGQSIVYDVIETFETNGASGDPLIISRNLVNGSYPYSGDGNDFTGSCINLADDGGSWLTADSNTCVNMANNGVMLGNGDNLVINNNTSVSDGKAGVSDAGSTVSSTFGNGIVAYHYVPGGAAPTNVTVTSNASGHRRWNGSSFEAADYFIPEADTASGNTNTSPVNAAAEQAAVDAWEAARVAATVTVGPR